jgi:hypothetical protein
MRLRFQDVVFIFATITTMQPMAGTKQKASTVTSAKLTQSQARSMYALATKTRKSSLKGIKAKKLQLAS